MEMKYLPLIFMLFFNFKYSQSLDAGQIHQISKYEFDHLDHLMVNGHQFKRMSDIENQNQKVYTNDSDELDRLVVLTVIKDKKGCANILSIVNRSQDDIIKLKNELPLEGFEYQGKKKMSEEITISQFINGKVIVSVTDTRTSTGAYQVLLMCKEY